MVFHTNKFREMEENYKAHQIRKVNKTGNAEIYNVNNEFIVKVIDFDDTIIFNYRSIFDWKKQIPHVVKILDYDYNQQKIELKLPILSPFPKIDSEFSFATKINWINQIAKGINHLHKRNYVHADIKKHNIMLNKKNECIIIDLDGISKLNDSNTHSSNSYVMGTLEYLPPEYFECHKKNVNYQKRKSYDIWAFGIVIVELLIGDEIRDVLINDVFNISSNKFNKRKEILQQELYEWIEKLPFFIQSAEINSKLQSLLKEIFIIDYNQRIEIDNLLQRIGEINYEIIKVLSTYSYVFEHDINDNYLLNRLGKELFEINEKEKSMEILLKCEKVDPNILNVYEELSRLLHTYRSTELEYMLNKVTM
ncbi:hypothetical protein ABK040_010899 [Willaertia magna]